MSNFKFANSNPLGSNSLKLSYIEKFLGLSKTKVYTMLINNNFPYFKHQKIIRVFSQNLEEFINQKKYTNLTDFSSIKSLPEIIDANTVSILLNISKSQTYKIMGQEISYMKFGKRILIKKIILLIGYTLIWIISHNYDIDVPENLY